MPDLPDTARAELDAISETARSALSETRALLNVLRREEETPAIRVLVVDDQAMVRQGFSALLAAQPEIEVVGDAVTAADPPRDGGAHPRGGRPVQHRLAR